MAGEVFPDDEGSEVYVELEFPKGNSLTEGFGAFRDVVKAVNPKIKKVSLVLCRPGKRASDRYFAVILWAEKSDYAESLKSRWWGENIIHGIRLLGSRPLSIIDDGKTLPEGEITILQ